MGVATAHEADFYAWTQEQAAALRRVAALRLNLPGVDIEQLAEEIEELGGSDLRALESDLARVIEHLLKLQYSSAPDPRQGWMVSVIEHRDRLESACRRSRALARQLPGLLPDAWRRARKLAAAGLVFHEGDAAALPPDCPYSLAQITDDGWWPESPLGNYPCAEYGNAV